MIPFNKVFNPLWLTCKLCCKQNVNCLVIKNRIRLIHTELPAKVFPKRLRPVERKKSSRLAPIAWVLLVIPVSAFGLGTWQIQRKMWKESLIKALEEKTKLEPVDLPLDFEELQKMEYHPVHVTGKFDHSREIYIGPRSLVDKSGHYSFNQGLMSKSTAGFLVVTPFILSDRDSTILVNRGWVPSEKKHPNRRPEGQITDEVEIVGLVRLSEKRPPLGMKNIPEKGFWMYRDFYKMSEITGAEPVMIDAVKSTTVPGGPIGGQTVIGLRNEHLSYIFTWYSLCIASSWMWYSKYIRKLTV